MKWLFVLAAVLGLAASGCADGDTDDLVSTLTYYRMRMCMCPDAACAQSTNVEYQKWRDRTPALTRARGKDADILRKIDINYDGCLASLSNKRPKVLEPIAPSMDIDWDRPAKELRRAAREKSEAAQ